MVYLVTRRVVFMKVVLHPDAFTLIYSRSQQMSSTMISDGIGHRYVNVTLLVNLSIAITNKYYKSYLHANILFFSYCVYNLKCSGSSGNSSF